MLHGRGQLGLVPKWAGLERQRRGWGWHQARGHAATAPPGHVHLADPCARLRLHEDGTDC